MENFNWIEYITKLAITYLPTVLLGLFTLIFGLYVTKLLTKIFRKIFKQKNIDPALEGFLTSIVNSILKIIVFLSALGIIGIQTTSFVAILGSAGLAVGLALQGSLSNFAGGVLIIILKPFKVGDVITAQGHTASVDSISIFVTTLRTPDNKLVMIPNGPLANGSIINVTAEPTRRVDLAFGIGYGDDLKKAKELILNTIKNDSRVMQDPAPFIAVSELADSSVNFIVRVWTKTEDYWGVYFDSIEKVKLVLDENNISIPFPQRDVHLHEIEKGN